MGGMGWLLLDGILVILAVYIIFRYARMGFARSLVNVVGIVAAFVAAALLSGLIGSWIYTAFIRGQIVEAVSQLASSPMAGSASQALNYIPAILLNLLSASYGNNTGTMLQEAINTQRLNAPEYVADQIVSPAVTPVISGAAFLVLFILLILLVKLVARAFQNVNELPLVGPVNIILGAALGILVACIILSVIVEVVEFLSTINGGEGLLISKDLINHTYFYRFLRAYNPLELFFNLLA